MVIIQLAQTKIAPGTSTGTVSTIRTVDPTCTGGPVVLRACSAWILYVPRLCEHTTTCDFFGRSSFRQTLTPS
jgi:hypothetical protein